MLRNRLALLLTAGVLAGCAANPSAAPVPSASPSTQPAAPRSQAQGPASRPAVVATPPSAGMVDSLLAAKQYEDLAEAVRLAADSAADERALDQLAGMHPADSGAEPETNLPARWDIDVATWGSHERVRWYLDYFTGPGHERMQIWIDRLPRYEPMIRARLSAANMPEDLVYLALIESGFSNTAVSRARAVGMWQFMRPTGIHYGLRVDRWVDERRDPVQATDAAVRFLSDLYDRFGSLYLAAAAYNAGGGKISGSLRRMGIQPASSVGSEPDGADEADADAEDEDELTFSDADFFKLYDGRYIRRETKDYVPKLIAAALIAKEPRRYGFRPALPVEPFPLDSIVVDGMTGLDVIARLADTTLTAIRELNPQYLRLTTPPATRSTVRLPAGKSREVAALYGALDDSARISFRLHTARKGQTVESVAAAYGVPATLIYEANPDLRGGKLRTGRELVVPVGGEAAVAVAREMARPEPVSARSGGGRYHRVKRGETLSGIARRYRLSTAQLKRMNGLSSSTVRTGQRLRVGGSSHAATAVRIASSADAAERRSHAKGGGSDAARAATRTHKVRKGDTLTGIAQRYGVSTSAIKSANRMSGSTVKVGQTLRIPAKL